MKKLILFLVLVLTTTFGFSQPPTNPTAFPNGINFKPGVKSSTDFDDLLTQNPNNFNVEKRILKPESSHLDPAFSPIYAWGDSLTNGDVQVSYPTQLTTLLGYTVTNKGIGGETSTQIKDRLVADTGNYSKSVIIWAGRNNFFDGTKVKADIATMISTLGHTRYLVMGILNSTNGAVGTTQYNQIVALNADLKSIYGSKYVPIREIIVASYNPSLPQDVIDHNNDVPPTSLRIVGDALHLNTAGYSIVASELYKRLGVLYNQNGYLQSKDFKYYFESFSPLHTFGDEQATGLKRFSNTQTITTGTTGRGLFISPVLTAGANSQKLIGLDVVNVFSPGAFTGTEFYHASFDAGIGTLLAILNKNSSTGSGASARYRLSNSADNADFGIRSTTHGTNPSGGFISVSNSSSNFSIGIGVNDLFKLYPTGSLVLQSGGAFTDAGFRLDTQGTGRFTGNLTIPSATIINTPTTSASAYDFLSRNTSTGVVEKITSASVQPAITATTSSDYYRGDKTFQPLNSAVIGSVLTGYVSGAGTVSATDNVLQAIQKLNGNDLLKAPLSSPSLTGTPTAPTATAGTNTTQLATTAFTQAAVSVLDGNVLHKIGNEAFSGLKSGNNGTGSQVELLGTTNGVLTASTGSSTTIPAVYAVSSTAQSVIKLAGSGGFTGKLIEAVGTSASTVFSVDNVGAINGVKAYTALVTQLGTSAPTVTILGLNQIGSIVPSFVSTGRYRFTLTGAFTANKTVISVSPNYSSGGVIMNHERQSADAIDIYTLSNNLLANGVMTNALLEIRVYP